MPRHASCSRSDQLVQYGWTEAVCESFTHDSTPARITRVDRAICDAVTSSDLLRVRSGRFDLCTGDWVTVADGTVVDFVPRRTAIMRAAVSGRAESQALAANIDAVGIVTALDGDVDLGGIERMLALAWESGAQPIVILTKSDAAEHVADTVAAVQAIAPGCSVLAISATTGDALDILTAMLDGTIVLIGPSGAGKSTLANALIGAEVLATNAVRTVDGNFGGDVAGGQPRVARHRIQRPGEHHLRDRPPDPGELQLRLAGHGLLGRLPHQHLLVQAASAQVRGDVAGLLNVEAKLLRVRRGPADVATGTCTAIAFAASFRERVERLVLYGSYPHGDALTPPGVADAIVVAVRAHWRLGSRLLSDIFLGGADAAEQERFARLQRESATAETAAALLSLVYRLDVRAHLPLVCQPATVVHRARLGYLWAARPGESSALARPSFARCIGSVVIGISFDREHEIEAQ